MDLSDFLLSGAGVLITIAGLVLGFVVGIARAYEGSNSDPNTGRSFWLVPIVVIALGVLMVMAGCQG